MIDTINIGLALLSAGLGLIGWLAPRYTLATLDLTTTGSTMGLSEIRAASGALYVVLSLGAVLLASPVAYAMLGFAWAGAALGRLTSIFADEQPTQRTWSFFWIEAAVAGALLALNL
ncbi:MAG: DUF4345 family protein [Pseudomonadota bacterium]